MTLAINDGPTIEEALVSGEITALAPGTIVRLLKIPGPKEGVHEFPADWHLQPNWYEEPETAELYRYGAALVRHRPGFLGYSFGWRESQDRGSTWQGGGHEAEKPFQGGETTGRTIHRSSCG